MLQNITPNYFDIMLLFIILLSSFFAFNKGFIRSVLSLAGWIFSIVFTYKTYPYSEPILLKYMSTFAASAVGYGGVLLLFLLFFMIFNYAVYTAFDKMRGGIVDKLFGVAFGITRGILVIIIFFVFTSLVSDALNGYTEKDDTEKNHFPQFVSNSASYPFLLWGRGVVIAYMPESIKNSLFTPQVKQKHNDTIKITSELNKNIRLLSKYVDLDTLKIVKNDMQKDIASEKSELEIGINAVQKLFAIYIKLYDDKKIPESNAISEIDLNNIRGLLKKAEEELENHDKNRDIDLIEHIVEQNN